MTTTATTTRTCNPRVKPSRSATLTTASDGSLILWLATSGVIRAYALTPLPSDFGAAYRLMKADNGDGQMDEYDVLLDGPRSACECLGFLRHQHWKHLEALAALVAAGKLPTARPQATLEPTEFDDP